MYKTRSHTTFPNTWRSFPIYSKTGNLVNANGYLQTPSSFEDSQEYLVSFDGGRRSTFKPCFHYKVRRKQITDRLLTGGDYLSGSPSTLGYVINQTPDISRFWDGSRYSLNDAAGTGSGSIGSWMEPPIKVVPSLVDYFEGSPYAVWPTKQSEQQLGAMAIHAIIPRIKSDANGLVNDIIEIKQVSSILSTCKRVKEFFRAAKLFERGLSSGYSLRKLATAVSDVYLQWSFNIAPILGDILGIAQALHDVDRKLHWLRSNEGKRLTGHYQYFLNEDYANTGDVDFSVPITDSKFIANNCQARCQSHYFDRVYHATLDYQYYTDLTGGPGDRLRALLDDLGVNLNPSIIWNAYPWTFVLDWVVNVSSFLDQFKETEIGIYVYMKQFCHSIKINRNSVMSCGDDHAGVWDAFAVSEDLYDRKVYPGTTERFSLRSIQTSGLSAMELSLLVALGFAKTG